MAIDNGNSIYVGGLLYGATEEELRRAFSYYGNIVDVKVLLFLPSFFNAYTG